MNWIGLFDAVKMVFKPTELFPLTQVFPDTVPGNVKTLRMRLRQRPIILKINWFCQRHGLGEMRGHFISIMAKQRIIW